MPRELSGLPEVEVELSDNAGLRDVVSALRRRLPELEKGVIRPDADYLEDTVVFNFDGRFYLDGEDVKLKDGDRLRLLTQATGG